MRGKHRLEIGAKTNNVNSQINDYAIKLTQKKKHTIELTLKYKKVVATQKMPSYVYLICAKIIKSLTSDIY